MPNRSTEAAGQKPANRINRRVLRRHIRTIGTERTTGFGQRREALLRRLRPALGPVQWEHLTSHCHRVGETAGRIGHALGLMPHEAGSLRRAGLVHDIGKCLIPETILAKPGPLSRAEWRTVARHDRDSAWVGGLLGLAPRAVRMVRHHHRRFDEAGPTSGNRRRLGSGEQDLSFAVLNVADALDAMLSNRPYQPARSYTDALGELHKQRGQQFHPTVVDAVSRIGPGFLQRAA